MLGQLFPARRWGSGDEAVPERKAAAGRWGLIWLSGRSWRPSPQRLPPARGPARGPSVAGGEMKSPAQHLARGKIVC
ncbi:hypothetical protein FOB42_12830 [Bordetella bronchiseptica]|nr:hypothetical protein FOB42_12830 [Bordetella bronchiseptica]